MAAPLSPQLRIAVDRLADGYAARNDMAPALVREALHAWVAEAVRIAAANRRRKALPRGDA
jgi:hypothetical protein